MMRTFWQLNLTEKFDVDKRTFLLPDQLVILQKGEKILQNFAKEHNLMYYDDSCMIKISDEERTVLTLLLPNGIGLVNIK